MATTITSIVCDAPQNVMVTCTLTKMANKCKKINLYHCYRDVYSYTHSKCSLKAFNSDKKPIYGNVQAAFCDSGL